MRNFTSAIHTDKGSLVFYFVYIPMDQGARYHVSALDKSGKSIIFLMEEKGTDNWMIKNISNLPRWIQKIENRLSEALVAHLREAWLRPDQ